MTLKKINPDELFEGQEAYIKVIVQKVKTSDGRPVLMDIAGNLYYPSNGEPIYTHEDTPELPWWLLLKKGDKFVFDNGVQEKSIETFNGVIKIGIDAHYLSTEGDCYFVKFCYPYTDPMKEFMESLTPEQVEAVEKYKQLTEQK